MSKLYVLAGPAMGQSFEFKDDICQIGRAPENQIKISDRTVSRKHLKIVKKGDKYFIKDLKSQNGTYFEGEYINSDVEVEVREGIPIAIGMTVICIGQGCKECMTPFLGVIEPALTKEAGEREGVVANRRKKTQKDLEVFYKVSDLLMANLPLRETLQEILDHLLDLLKRIDRSAFIFLDPKKGEVGEIIFRLRKTGDDTGKAFCREVLNRVIAERRPVVIPDVHSEESDKAADTLEMSGIASVMCFPLIKGAQIIGAIYVDSQEKPYAFRKEDRSLFLDLCQRIAMTIDYTRFAFEFDTIRLTKSQFQAAET